MNNAEKFRDVFGFYATELWAMPEKDFLKWLNDEYEEEKDWANTDLGKFTASCPDEISVEAWGGWIGKNTGFTPFGWTIDHNHRTYYFNLDGSLNKTKAD